MDEKRPSCGSEFGSVSGAPAGSAALAAEASPGGGSAMAVLAAPVHKKMPIA